MLPDNLQQPQDGRPRVVGHFVGTNHELIMSEDTVNGRTTKHWALMRGGEPVIVRPFTTTEAMKADLSRHLAELRLARTAEQAQQAERRPSPQQQPTRQELHGAAALREAPRPEPREFASVLVGVWGDASKPYVNQWVNVPPGETDPEKCRMVPCHGPVPRPTEERPLYVVAKKVTGHPELATVEASEPTLEAAIEKAGRIDHRHRMQELGLNRRTQRPKAPEPAKAAELKVEESPAPAPEPPRAQWPVVRYSEPFVNGSVFVEVAEVFPDREKALEFASGLQDAAVFPYAIKDIKPGDRLVAEAVAEPKDANEKKLNRIVMGVSAQEEVLEAEQPQAEQRPVAEVSPRPEAEELTRDNGFRPFPVEKPPVPTRPDYVYAIVRVVGTQGQGAHFEVAEVVTHRAMAELRCLLSSDAAIFPRPFLRGEVAKGQWFGVESLSGFDGDPNAQKLQRLIEKERAIEQQANRPKPRPEQGPSLAL